MSEFILPHSNPREEKVFVAPNYKEQEKFSLPHSNPRGTGVDGNLQDSELVLEEEEEEEDEPEVEDSVRLKNQVEAALNAAKILAASVPETLTTRSSNNEEKEEEKEKIKEPLNYENWQSRRELNKQPITARNVDDFKTDLSRLGTRHVRNATEFFMEEIRGFKEEIGFASDELTPSQKRELANNKTEELINKFVEFPIDFERENVTDAYGRILPTETAGGLGVEIASLIGGSYLTTRFLKRGQTPTSYLDNFIGFEITAQFLGNYDVSLLGLVEQLTVPEDILDVSPDMLRQDGSQKSKQGWLGPIQRDDGLTMTEYSIGVEINGIETDMPTMVPTLTKEEIETLRTLPDGENIPQAIVEKAIDHAMMQIKKGDSPFFVVDPKDLENKERGIAQDILDKLTIDEDSTQTEKRVTMFVENMGIAAVLKLVTMLPVDKVTTKIRETVLGKRPSDMTDDELQASLEKLINANKPAVPKPGELDAGTKQIQAQAKEGKTLSGKTAGWLRSLYQQLFLRNGYAPPAIHDAMLSGEYANRQIIKKGQDIGDRIDVILSSLYNSDPVTVKTAQRILTTDIRTTQPTSITYKRTSKLDGDGEEGIAVIMKGDPEKRIAELARKENISEELARELIDARVLMDGLSVQIANTPGFSAKAKEAIESHYGAYLRRSFEAFENNGFRPTDIATQDLINLKSRANFDEKIILNAENGKVLNSDEISELALRSKELAEIEVKQLRESFDDDLFEHTGLARSVSRIYQKNQTLGPEMRAFLGEIKNPSENIILSVARASRMLHTQQLYNTISREGRNKYIFGNHGDNLADNSIAAKRAGDRYGANIYTHQINGTNSTLDKKFTTPEFAKFIYRQEDKFVKLESDTRLANMYRSFIAYKGFTKLQQTAYSHRTQLRNGYGGYQMGLLNGHVLGQFNKDASSMLIKEVLTKGNRTIEARLLASEYDELLGEGVINTSVVVGQSRAMIEGGSNSALPQLVRWVITPNEKVYKTVTGAVDSRVGRNIKGAVLKPIEVYQAGDDLWKAGVFYKELATLKKAFPVRATFNADLAVLKKQAALTVRNNMPNYDLLPPLIKGMRQLPAGDYVAFPTSVIRSYGHTFKQSFREMSSVNSVLRQRGIERFTGAVFTPMLTKTAAVASGVVWGLSREEINDRKTLTSSYSDGSDMIFFRDSEGELYSSDFKSLNTYDTIVGPFSALYHEVIKGNLQGKETEDILMEGMGAAFGELLNPYLAKPMASGMMLSLTTALLNEDGKNLEGDQIVVDGQVDWDALGVQFLKEASPGSIPVAKKAIDAFTETPRLDGTYPDKGAAAAYQLGFNINSQSNEALISRGTQKMREIKALLKQNKMARFDINSDPDEVEKDSLAVNAIEFQHQQDLYLIVSAATRRLGDEDARRMLKSLKYFSNESVERMLAGVFTPQKFNLNLLEGSYNRKARINLNLEDSKKFESNISEVETRQKELYERMLNLPLDDATAFNPKEWLEQDAATPPTRLARGGEVSTKVPNAPSEPDERINKLTGIPYNEGAGAAYMDEDDPMRVLKMNQGGGVEEEREGYSAAGAIIKGGMKLFSKAKAPVPTKAPVVEKTKDMAMPEELNPKVSNAEYDEKTVDMSDKSDATLKPYKKVERYATKEEMSNALDKSKREKIDIPIEEGSEVGIRLDIPAYQKGKDSAWVPTIHDEKGTGLTSHRATVALRNVDLRPSKGNEEQAYRIKMKDYHISQIDELVLEGRLRDKYRTGNLEAGKLIDATTKEGKDKIKKIKKAYDKTNYSRIKGNLVNRTDEENYRLAQEALNSNEWTQVGYNPDRHSYYFDRKTGEPVLGGDEGIQVGPLVLIKNAEFGNRKDFKYASGGKVLNTLRRARN